MTNDQTGEPTIVEEEAEEKAIVAWQPVPTVVVDATLGNARVGGVYRIVLAEFVLNPEEGAQKPMARPVINIALTPVSLRNLAAALNALVEQLPDAK